MSDSLPPYQLHAVGRFPEQLDRLRATAEQRQVRALMIDVGRQMLDQLRTRPREWGDPYSNYRGLNAVGYGRTTIEAGIRVEYAVHDAERLVWISALRALPGSPFA